MSKLIIKYNHLFFFNTISYQDFRIFKEKLYLRILCTIYFAKKKLLYSYTKPAQKKFTSFDKFEKGHRVAIFICRFVASRLKGETILKNLIK